MEEKKYLTLSQAAGMTDVKSRLTLGKYVKNHRFDDWSIDKIQVYRQEGGRNSYLITPEWIEEFNKRFRQGILKPSRHGFDEISFSISEMEKYCEKFNLKTIKQFKEDVKNRFKTLNK